MASKLGTALIMKTAEGFEVSFYNHHSYLRGEQFFLDREQARAFCAERNLRIVKWNDWYVGI